MENIFDFLTSLYSKFGPVIFVPIVLFAIVGIGAQWMLYEKCNLKGVASVVPVWNVIEFLKIMGRPAWQALIVMIPPAAILALMFNTPLDTISYSSIGVLTAIWLVFMTKVYIELCQCFGRKKMVDYISVILFNGLYVLSLGLSYEAKYYGPLYNTEEEEKETQLA